MDTLSLRISKILDSPDFFGNESKIPSPERIKNEYLSVRNYLIDRNSKDTLIALSLDRDYRYILVILVCMEVGLAFIPLNSKYPESYNRKIKKNAKFDAVFDNESYEIAVKNSKQGKLASFAKNNNDPLYIIFTSGSSGDPKGVIITRGSFINFVNWVEVFFSNITSQDRLLNVAEFTFDMSFLDIALLITRKPTIFVSNFKGNIFKLAAEIENNKISTIATVPNNLSFLASEDIYDRADFSSVRNLLLGGARFSEGLYHLLSKNFRGTNIYNLYGPTEATVYCTAKEINFDSSEIINGVVTVGQNILNCATFIFDDLNNTCKPYQKGEVFISGHQIMKGYINNPKKNSESLQKINNVTYYKTGDIGFKDTNDNLFITGRMDDTIKAAGYRVNLSDIDSYISSISGVIEVASIAIEDQDEENRVICFIRGHDKGKILNKIDSTLPKHIRPKKVIFIEYFPLNKSGKIAKKTLKENFSNGEYE